MGKLFYRAISSGVSVLGGIVATAIFHRIWRVAADEEEIPSATDASPQLARGPDRRGD